MDKRRLLFRQTASQKRMYAKTHRKDVAMNRQRRLFSFTLLLALAFALTGCGSGSKETQQESAVPEQKTVVTMMYYIELPAFEQLVEDTYPDIDLKIEQNTTVTIDGEGERRLRHGHGTDIVTMLIPRENIGEYLMDLSTEDYASLYQNGVTHSLMVDGRTLFLPLPGQYTGYIYNATLVEQMGLSAPTTPAEMIALMDKAAEAGLGVGDDGTLYAVESADKVNVAQYLFGTQVPDFLGLADGIRWSSNMQSGQGRFADAMGSCLDLLETAIERGYLNPVYMTGSAGNHVPVESRMSEGSLLLTYGKVSLLDALNRNNGEYKYGMLPFLSEEGNHAWTLAVPDAYLSLNRALQEPGNEEKLDACHRILRLLSTPEGQQAVMASSGAFQSYLTDLEPEKERIPGGLKECVEGGYVYNLQVPGKVLYYFGDRMIAVLNDKVSMEEAMDAVDNYYKNGDDNIDYDQSLIGEMAEDMCNENYNVRQGETAIGNLVADAAREITGADFAFINGGSVRGSLYQGPVFGYELDQLCPYPNNLVVLETDAATIRAMLQNGISRLIETRIPNGRFLNVSGICYSFSWPTQDEEAKLLSVTLPDGSELSEDETYTITVTNYMAGEADYFDNNGDGYTMLNVYENSTPLAEGVKLVQETEYILTDALKAYFEAREGTAIEPGAGGRIEVVGKNEE